jgi:hypothetical protein
MELQMSREMYCGIMKNLARPFHRRRSLSSSKVASGVFALALGASYFGSIGSSQAGLAQVALSAVWDGAHTHVFYVSASDPHGTSAFVAHLTDPDAGGRQIWSAGSSVVLNSPVASVFDGSHLRAYYLDGSGNVLEGYSSLNSPNTSSVAYISHLAGAPPAAGNFYTQNGLSHVFYGTSLTGYWDGSQVHVFYVAQTDGKIHELFRSLISPWMHRLPVSSEPTADSSEGFGLTSVWDGSVGHVYYVTGAAGVTELYYNGSWGIRTVDPGPATNGIGFMASGFFSGEQLVVYGESDGLMNSAYFKNSIGHWVSPAPMSATGMSVNRPVFLQGRGATQIWGYVGTDDTLHDGVFNTSIVDYNNVCGGPYYNFPSTGSLNSPTGIASIFDGTKIHIYWVGFDLRIWTSSSTGNGVWTTPSAFYGPGFSCGTGFLSGYAYPGY